MIVPEWFEVGLLKEIFVAIIGGATTMTVVKTRERIENSRLTREYPVEGHYITRFEDETREGTRVWVTAPATLRQRGLSVSGSTRFDKRIWIIDARISKDGYLTGTYKAQDPYDKGFGNLFLRIDSVYPHENCHSAAAKLPPLSSLFCSPAGSQIRRRPERSTSLLFFS